MPKKLFVSIVYITLAVLLTLMPLTGGVVYAANLYDSEWIPPELEVTPSSQNVTSSDTYRAEWTVCIYEGTGTYTVDFWSGDGSHYTRVFVNHDSCQGWIYNYYGATGWYYQTWKITGQGGPDYDYTSVYK